MIVLKLLLWILPIAINIYVDRNGAKRNYFFVNGARVTVAMFYCGLLFGDLFSSISNWREYLPLLVFLATSYWIFFEAGLNIVRGRIKQLGFWKGLLYYDQVEGDSGWFDMFFTWTGPVIHAIAKLLALVACIHSVWVVLK